jgi:hypothetical protein
MYSLHLPQLVTNGVELRHPRLEEMTVLQKYPVAFLTAFFDELSSNFLLALPQTLLEELIKVTHFLGMPDDLFVGVSPLTEHEYDRRNFVR